MPDKRQYVLRPFRRGDADALIDVTRLAIERIGRLAYSDAQLTVWLANQENDARFSNRVSNGHRIVAACDKQDKPAAYALWEPNGHFDMLYCHPDHAGRGLAGQLIERVLSDAKALHLERIWTEASDLARQIFERAGFAMLGRREFDLRGVPIHNWSMEARL